MRIIRDNPFVFVLSLTFICLVFLSPASAVPLGDLQNSGAVSTTNQSEDGDGTGSSNGVPIDKILSGAKPVNSAREGVIYNCSYLNFRQAPWGSIITSYPKGKKVMVLGQKGDWYHVEISGQKGYCHHNYIKIIGGATVAPVSGGSGEDPASEVDRILGKFAEYKEKGDNKALIRAVVYSNTYVKGVKDPVLKLRLLRGILSASRNLVGLKIDDFNSAGSLGGDSTPTGGNDNSGSTSGSGSGGNSGSYNGTRPSGKPPLASNATREQRLNYYAEDIIFGGCSVGVPPSIVAAQFILESSAGKHMPRNSNNPFGIKCGSSSKCVPARTKEYNSSGSSYHITAKFRAFDSVGEAIQAHASRLTGKTRGLSGIITKPFNAALAARDYNGLIDRGLRKYATSPTYGSTLKSIIRNSRLKERFDTKCPAVTDML